MAPRFHSLKISAVRPLTADAVAVTFELPDQLVDAYRFLPGQYLTLRTTIGGRDERRSYSICSIAPAGDLPVNQLEVGIKQVAGGVFSTFAQSLEPGSELRVMTPQGRFTIAPAIESANELANQHASQQERRRQFLFVAAGSGITPCLSMLKTVLSSERESRATLVYGNRNMDSIMFRDDLAALKDQYTTRFSLFHVLSRERQDATIFNGRIDAGKIRALASAGLIDAQGVNGIYCCGPQLMINAVTEALQGLGTPLERVHFELFTTADMRERTPIDGYDQRNNVQSDVQNTAAAEKEGVEVKIIFDGSDRTIRVNPATETVLQAATRAGLDLPFSCQGGMCCTCRCKIASGKVELDVNFSLAQWEIEAGYTLACQARPRSSSLVLDFDAT